MTKENEDQELKFVRYARPVALQESIFTLNSWVIL